VSTAVVITGLAAALLLALVVILVLVARHRRQTLAWGFHDRSRWNLWILQYLWTQPQPFAPQHTTTLAQQAQRYPQEVDACINLLVGWSYLAVDAVYSDNSRSVHLTQAGYDSLEGRARLEAHIRNHH
jgi:hypothetical protein